MYYIGVDLGGTNIAVGVVEGTEGKIVAKGSVPTLAQREPDEIIKDMAKLCNELLEKINITMDDIEYIGIATPGGVDTDRGIVSAGNLPFREYPIVDKLKEFSGAKKVLVANDGNAAAKGEVAFGAAKSCKDAIMVTLGTGVGGGIIIDGKIYTGSNYAGGELGHMVIEASGPVCSCGLKGCWEVYSSATGLINMTKKALEGKTKADTVMFDLIDKEGKVTGRTAFDAMRAGDELGKKVVDEYIRYMAVGILSTINIFQPEVIVIGGGLSNEREYLLNPLNEILAERNARRRRKKNTVLKIAELGNDAGIIGAAMLGI